MWNYSSRFHRRRCNHTLILLILCTVIIKIIYWPQIPPGENVSLPTSQLPTTIRTHDFHLYPQSQSAIEYDRIQIDNIAKSMFQYNENNLNKNVSSSQPLKYSEAIFRSAPFPVIWLDEQGDVHWNRPAQHEMLNYLLEKQFPKEDISTCLTRQLFVLRQWVPGGFFSRHHTFIEEFGETLYSPSMVLPTLTRFNTSQAAIEDLRDEGILRYYHSISLCSSHLNHPKLKTLRDRIRSIERHSPDVKSVEHIDQLFGRDESTVKLKYSQYPWRFGYDHVPHRRWLFDRNRKEIKKILTYHSPTKLLIDHSNEHIYYNQTNPIYSSDKWRPRNNPYVEPDSVLDGTTTQFTVQDRIFSSFLRYMILLFCSPLPPRIQTLTKLLAHHWSEYLSDKFNQPYEEALANMAAIFIRRGDKMPEDSFWIKHRRWRNISMYVKGIVDAEKNQQIKYKTVFVMTDDASVMDSIQEYARVGLKSTNRDEPYAREHLHGRTILYNVFEPQSCFESFMRFGFDQFLVNIQFLTDYASLVVGHTDSNVGRYLEEIIYVNQQHQKGVQTRTYVINAPDSLD